MPKYRLLNCDPNSLLKLLKGYQLSSMIAENRNLYITMKCKLKLNWMYSCIIILLILTFGFDFGKQNINKTINRILALMDSEKLCNSQLQLINHRDTCCAVSVQSYPGGCSNSFFSIYTFCYIGKKEKLGEIIFTRDLYDFN